MKLLLSMILFLSPFLSLAGYFQQQVSYKMNVKLEPDTKMLTGTLIFSYTNNSPDALPFLWFHQYPNAFKNNTTPFARQQREMKNWIFEESDPENYGYMNSTYRLKGQDLEVIIPDSSIDLAKVMLPNPIQPGGSITIEIEFEVKVPKVFSRIGQEDGYFGMTQWYPRIAAYDRFGWHPIPYLDFGEFYGEFGDYEVTITLPGQYELDATGMLVNSPEEVSYMQNLADFTTRLYDVKPSERDTLIAEWKAGLHLPEQKTVTFKAENVIDFAWFAGPDYFLLQRTNPKGVLVNVLITPQNLDSWKHSATFTEEAIFYYSQFIGEYPYPKVSVVDGYLDAGGGMEYPMITVIAVSGDKITTSLDQVITHEVGHNWFQAIIATNERAHAWMDEGINTYYENRTMDTKYGPDRSFINNPDSIPLFGSYIGPVGSNYVANLSFQGLTWKDRDLPNHLDQPSYIYDGNAAILYTKTGLIMKSLEFVMGKEKFDKAMQTYWERWKFKHPYPEDFYAVMSEVNGESLDWFFDQWMHTTEYPDFTAGSLEPIKGEPNTYTVKLQNVGGLSMPAPVRVTFKDGSSTELRWNPESGITQPFSSDQPVSRIEVNPDQQVLELDYKNNDPFFAQPEFNWLFRLPSLHKDQYNFFPLVYYEHAYEKWQLGMGVWSGNPISGQDLLLTTLYYAPVTSSFGYRIQWRDRIPKIVSGFMDYGFTFYDQQGLRKQEFYVGTHLSRRNRYFMTELGFGNYHLYDMNHHNRGIFQPGHYLTSDITSQVALKNREQSGYITVRLSKSIPVETDFVQFTKASIEFNYDYKFNSKNSIGFRLFTGGAFGKLPNQETFFLGGSPDARHDQYLVSRKGPYSVLNGIGNGTGTDMPGYAIGRNSFSASGKAAFSTRLSLTTTYTPTLFLDAGNVYPTVDDIDLSHVVYDAGMVFGAGFVTVTLPVWVSDPLPGESRWDFRMLIKLEINRFFNSVLTGGPGY